MKAVMFSLLFLTPFASAPGTATPAHEAARLYRRGVNIGNYFEVPPGAGWKSPYSIEDIKAIKVEGFDHVRLPAGWHHYTGPGPKFTIDPAFTGRVDKIVKAALAENLAVIVNIHHFDDLTSRPAENAGKFVAIWKQLAKHYAGFPGSLAFELLNEPRDKATTEVMNGLYAKALAAIRTVDPKRIVFVGPGKWNTIKELPNLKLPADDRRLIVTVHCYDPFPFTHQSTSWTNLRDLSGVQFPGPPEKPLRVPGKARLPDWIRGWVRQYNTLPAAENPSSPKAFEPLFEQAAAWGREHNRPIHLGEFGAYKKADLPSRLRFTRAMRQAAEKVRARLGPLVMARRIRLLG